MYYEPKWFHHENGVFARDKQYKLYSDGRSYNVEQDVLKQNDLSYKALAATEKSVKRKLEKVLKTMPNVQPNKLNVLLTDAATIRVLN